ncbi:hypothetical protein B9Z47_11920 [Limnohabitans sp. 2KL-1]|nr:hypothetical protein B9Z47_11920 [Limnohabitans sp. 2KL-1]
MKQQVSKDKLFGNIFLMGIALVRKATPCKIIQVNICTGGMELFSSIVEKIEAKLLSILRQERERILNIVICQLKH